jgi:regulator of cell morphogenesis and NO signaling
MPAACDSEWVLRPVSALAAHISAIYHARTRRELPVVIQQAAVLERMCRDDRAFHLRGLSVLLANLRDEVETHTFTEDDLLFPVLTARDHPAVLSTTISDDALVRLVGSLADDHTRIRRAIERLREHLSDGDWIVAETPEWLMLHRRVDMLCADLTEELELEDRWLLPRALEMTTRKRPN